MKRLSLLLLTPFLAMAFLFSMSTETVWSASESDLGIPFYPGSKPDPAYTSMDSSRGGITTQNAHLITTDAFDRVVEFYGAKLGKLSTGKGPGGTRQALWKDVSPDKKVRRTVTITGGSAGTKITITKITKG